MAVVEVEGFQSPWRLAGDFAARVFYYAVDMAVFIPLFVLYLLLRGRPSDRVAEATDNATQIIGMEEALGVFHEATWQDAILHNSTLVDIANFTYLNLHMPLLVVLGFLFFLSDARKHRVIRNTILLSAFVAVPVYMIFPVTPPRLLASAGHAHFGFVDTIPSEVRAGKPGAMANWYAAVPSYHFGWIALAALGVWWCWKSWIVRAAAVAFAAFMWWAIVVTGNHYFFDMVAGAAVVGMCFVLVRAFEQWTELNPGAVQRFTVRVGPLRLPF
ncbi:MAG: phosphatase PAP2 family protein [Dehalococcoidia bacterium]|nr:phosphatase PAP2 family protein [Dehalococcoidia bacterium]